MLTFLLIALIVLTVAGIVTGHRNAAAARREEERWKKSGRPCPLPILMPVCGRPQYLRKVLAALARAEGIGETLLVISQDGRDPEVSAMIDGIQFTEVVLLKHTRPFLGIFCYFWDSLHAVSTNIRFLLDFAFDRLGAGAAIVLEDDILPSRDFFRYCAWAHRHLLADERVLTVTGFNLHSRLSPEEGYDPRNHPCDMIENRENGRSKFTGWSWVIAERSWRRVRKAWSLLNWDIQLDETQRKRGLISYKPALARVRNIGMQGGINFTEEEGNPKWADIVISEETSAPGCPPRLLADDPVIPPFDDLRSDRPAPNERSRTRRRRLWLYGILAAFAASELFLFWRP